MISMLTNPIVSSLTSLSLTCTLLPTDYAPLFQQGRQRLRSSRSTAFHWPPSSNCTQASQWCWLQNTYLAAHLFFIYTLASTVSSSTLVPVYIIPMLRNPPRVSLRGLFQCHVSKHSADISTCMNDQELNLPLLHLLPGLYCFPPLL